MGAAASRLIQVTHSHSRMALGSACLGLLGSVWLWFQLRQPELEGRMPARQERKRVELQIDNTCNIEDVYQLDRKKLGEGSYGSVWKANKKDNTGETVAVKKINNLSESNVDRIASEIDIMKSLDHPSIIKLIDTYQNNGAVYLVMELALGGELFDRLIDCGRFTESQSAHCMRQILKGVGYCHGLHICLRSVKPEDIVCMTKDPIDKVVLKLIDFGLSTRFTPGECMTTKAGTPYYVAPQILAGKYDSSCDLWSCGVVMYVMLCGYPPFYGETDAEVLAKVRLGNYSFNAKDWKEVSEDAKNLIRMLLKMNPSDRYTADQALSHASMANH